MALEVNGRRNLTAVGDTSQVTVAVIWSDGTKRDVTDTVRWKSQDTSVATVSAGGLVTAVGLGAAAIEAGYEPLLTIFQVSVTPAGTFAIAGEVREPGQGPVAGVRVSESVSRRSTITDQAGKYGLAGLGGTHLRFEKDGYETGELDIQPDTTGWKQIQRIVRIMAGETAVVPKLTHMDMSYDVGADRCSPCRLIRLVSPRAGTMHFDLTWEPDPGSELYLWVGGTRFAKESNGQRLRTDAVIAAGENVVYVGYYRWRYISGSSIKFALATSMN